jgi:EmrB/QacA subfamily drug resistance transporter
MKNVLLWLVAIGFFMETLDSTIVNTAIPTMAKSLGESPLLMQSVVIAYSLTLAIFIPASGWIADRFGTRKVFLSAIFIFTLGSGLCATSHNLWQLVLARVLQGIGGSMLMPVGRLAVLRAFPGDQFLDAISFVTVPALIGPLIGPTLGGWLVEFASWHWIFLINIPIGLIGFITTMIAMPDSKSTNVPRFDIVGFLQLALSMLSISFALDGLSELGFAHATVLVLMIFGFACMVAYGLRASNQSQALFPLKLFRSHTYSIGLLGNLFARIGSSGMPFMIPLFLQLCLDRTPFAAGMMMIPVALAGILAKRLAAPFIHHFGYRPVLVYNTFLVGLAIASFALISGNEPTWIRVVQLAFFGTVNSLQFTAMNTLTLKDIPLTMASSGNSLFSMIQMLAMSFAVATAAAVLTAFMDHFHGQQNMAFALSAFHCTFICMGAITCTSAWIFWQLSPVVKTNEPKAPAVQID